ncbi:sensor histidine kinase [Paenibacillus methanolicus]|uniref:Two-component system sensor histidine kinase YesM n=1 Tax=Paenibacillus methanolicus TaxID=582686 RepID=A0A5S5C3Q1_9BACL|nr:sensor histidine kinase [Paenibacillus methanolicus]TYP73248.1 two-component system sensor histidine kinase YesM [Paenibacillus methanolicus]
MLQLAKQNHATIVKTMFAVNDKTITFLDNHLFDLSGPNAFWTNIETLSQIKQADSILERWSSDGTAYTLYMMNKVGKRTLIDLSHKDRGFKYLDGDAAEFPDWAKQAIEKRGAGEFRRAQNGGANVSYVRSILNAQNYNDVIGFLIVSNLEVRLMRDLVSVELPANSGIYLFNDLGELLLQRGAIDIPLSSIAESAMKGASGTFIAKQDGERWLYASSYERGFGTRLVYRVPFDAITGSQTSFQWFIMVVSVLYLAFVLLFLLYLLRIIVRPLHRLVAITKIYEPGVKLNIEDDLLRPDEFGILYGAFLRMTRRLDHSFEENYLMKIQQKENELATLHAQITPHLLYNTLDSIYWYALDQGNSNVGDMVKDLSKLLRIGLSKGKTMISIGEEAEHIQAYSRLQMKRYPDQFEVFWAIEEEVLAFTTPKVILQPLVENAIFHAVSGMDGEGAIWIRIRRVERTIEMSVEDNGFLPVDLERLERIVRGELDDKGYGIRNVNQRIQLHYGEEYGLRYCRRDGGGIRAVIRLPLQAHTASSTSSGA